jgi:quercetin dioxygenase-like cupin family protein
MKKFFAIQCVLALTLFSLTTLADGAKVTILMQKELDGLTNKEGLMLIVEYAPGMFSKAHRHDAHSFVYVLEGTVIMQVKGSDPVTLEAGQTFYESPNDIHLVSKNASNTKVARFVVFSLKERGSDVVIPVL